MHVFKKQNYFYIRLNCRGESRSNMPLIRTRVLLIGPRKRRQSIRHWDLVKDLIEQDRQMGQDPVAVVKPPWPLIPPFELGTIEQEWLRYRNVQKLVASGAIQPPRWFKESRLAPPNSGPFWGDPPVHGMDHKLPLRRHIWTHNLKPPTELMKMFLLRKEDRVYEKNFRQVIGFTPQEKVRRGLKENIPNAAREGRTTFNFFWQKKSLEKVETRYSQLVDEGVAEVEANRIVEREFQTAVAVRKRQQAFAAETARRSGKAVSAFQGHWVLDLIATLQERMFFNFLIYYFYITLVV